MELFGIYLNENIVILNCLQALGAGVINSLLKLVFAMHKIKDVR